MGVYRIDHLDSPPLGFCNPFEGRQVFGKRYAKLHASVGNAKNLLKALSIFLKLAAVRIGNYGTLRGADGAD